MQNLSRLKNSKITPYLLIIVISAITYLPHIARLTYYRDDWYYMADRFFGGAEIFHQMFWVDRPIRSYLYEILFKFFGLNPLPYNLLAYFWRLLSGVLCYWLFQVIWPAKPKVALWIAILFTVYPGYLWWVSGIEYQVNLISLCLQILSILLTILGVKQPHKWWIWLLLAGGAILTGWLYILIVDFAIGIELFRFVAVVLVIRSVHPKLKFPEYIKKVIRSWIIYLSIPVGFIAYRSFFFQNRRPETDIALQFSGLQTDFWTTIATWFGRTIESFYNVTVRGWLFSFYNNYFALENRDMLTLLLIGLLGSAILFLFFRQGKAKSGETPDQENSDHNWQLWLFLGGIIGVWGTTVPIVLMNRTILLEDLSHYTLSGSVAAAMILVVLITLIKPEKIQVFFLVGMAGLAIVSQQSRLINVIGEGQKIKSFWQQVSLRVPGLQEGTTVLANYPGIKFGDDYDVVWGPLNFSYLDPQDAQYYDGAVHYPYSGLKQNYLVSKDALVGAPEGDWYRTHAFVFDYTKLLVLDQPTEDSCVHVMDSRWPRLTLTDTDQILLLAEKSNIDVVIPKGEPRALNPMIFGNQATETWCTYYQQAELALQNENWQEVIAILHQAQNQGYTTADKVEWMPFLQAAFFLNDQSLVSEIAGEFTNNKFLRDEGCRIIPAMRENGYELTPSIIDLGRTLFCDESP
jgi:hypothetical protein